MDFDQPDDELTQIFAKHKRSSDTPPPPKMPDINLDDDGSELNKFTVELYIKSINAEMEVIESMRDAVKASPDPDLASSLASLEKSVGDKMKMLAELSMHKGRMVSTEKMKKNDNDIKRELALLKNSPAPQLDMGQNNTINIIGTRDEILAMALKQLEDRNPPIDV